MICSVVHCEITAHAKKLCGKHYRHYRKYGHPEAGPVLISDPEERFWSKVEKSDGCWLWTGDWRENKGGDKYGCFRLSVKLGRVSAHRYSYDLAYGDLTDEMVVDHRCHNTMCVRPDHLRAVTHKQNSENRSGAMRDTASGVRGVSKNGKWWMATITHNGRCHNLGRYGTVEEAAAVAQAKRNELFTHNDIDRLESA